MENTYHVKGRGRFQCRDEITVRQFLRKVLAVGADSVPANGDILTIYDEPRRRVVTEPFATLREVYLSGERLHLCYHVPGALLMTEERVNNCITYSDAYQAIPHPMHLPLEIDGRFLYPIISGRCTLGNFVEFLQRRGFLPKNSTSMTVHECFCWESVPAQTLDLTPGSPDLKQQLRKVILCGGPPIYCTFD